MLKDVEVKLKRKNAILFSRESACLQELIACIRRQNHQTLVLWALACVKEPLAIIESKYPTEKRPRQAYDICDQWAKGEVKMPIAKRAILDCHSVCKELDDKVDIALCHGIAQGLSTIHVESHALGLPFYELSAIVLQNKENYQEAVYNKIQYYLATLLYYQEHYHEIERPWAAFIMKEGRPNKEDELWKKRSQ